MLKIFYYLGFNAQFIIEVFLFLIPMEKKDRGYFRIVGSIIFEILYFAFMKQYPMAEIPREIRLFLTLLSGMLIILFCAYASIWDAIYVILCAYSIQHISYAISEFICIGFGLTEWKNVIQIVMFIIIMIISYIAYIKPLGKNNNLSVTCREAITAVLVIIPMVFVLSMLAEKYYLLYPSECKEIYMICRLYGVYCCLYVLVGNANKRRRIQIQNEWKIQQMLWAKQKQQYELSKSNIDMINRKCHDLKHQMNALKVMNNEGQRKKYIDEIKSSIMIYDSGADTGNEVLDTVLTEKCLLCERENIKWTCLADAKSLNFMDPIDLYTLFGNLLDNAIEGVLKLKNPEERVIAVNVVSKKNMCIIQVENYYEDEIKFKDGIPVTSKVDAQNHGIGFGSIMQMVEKYDGEFSIDVSNHIFMFTVILPT